ncbi:hypothetical protein FTUN_5593 [Frigoriglobus tundricola]|uniref:Uncharacterized protein n=1 Tax=Frigoriglobus tundricola TaxID=2774151 RepID=A0A6M5YXT0_9BACT|nr:hypothetical protein FTUN_5593 [Frigoriglobus tundricola]
MRRCHGQYPDKCERRWVRQPHCLETGARPKGLQLGEATGARPRCSASGAPRPLPGRAAASRGRARSGAAPRPRGRA